LRRTEQGLSEGALHYMKKNANAKQQFTLNIHIRKRLETWEENLLNLKSTPLKCQI